jgi:hypothetical protein
VGRIFVVYDEVVGADSAMHEDVEVVIPYPWLLSGNCGVGNAGMARMERSTVDIWAVVVGRSLWTCTRWRPASVVTVLGAIGISHDCDLIEVDSGE